MHGSPLSPHRDPTSLENFVTRVKVFYLDPKYMEKKKSRFQFTRPEVIVSF